MSRAKILPFIKPQTNKGELMGLPQDYACPNEPCPHCGRNVWYERKASLGGSWACGRCHPSYEMIIEQHRGNMNSIQFNEHMFLFMGVTLALTFIVYGLILTQKRPPDATPQKHFLAHREWKANVSAEEQAEQIIRSCWRCGR